MTITIKSLALDSQRLRADQPRALPLAIRRHDPVLDPRAVPGDPVHAHVVSPAGAAHGVEDGLVPPLRVPVGRVLDLDRGVGGVGVVN